MYIFKVLFKSKVYAITPTRTEAETLQELLLEYLESESVELVKIAEDKKLKNYALIYSSGYDEVITKYKTEEEAKENAFYTWSHLTETERKKASRFELVYFENENNFDNLGEYQKTIINFLNKIPYLFNSVTCEYLNETEAINEYREILEKDNLPHTDIYDVCDSLNNLDYYGCGNVFDVVYKWIA